jgi:hypothetical protein
MPMILRRLDEAGRARLIKRAHPSLSSSGCLIVIEFLAGEDRRRGSTLAALLDVESPRHPPLSWSDLDQDCLAAGFERTESLPLIGPLTATLAYKP